MACGLVLTTATFAWGIGRRGSQDTICAGWGRVLIRRKSFVTTNRV
jgi:hypothetical protein